MAATSCRADDGAAIECVRSIRAPGDCQRRGKLVSTELPPDMLPESDTTPETR